MKVRVAIQWTATARESIRSLPTKVRRGFIKKIGELRNCDPRQAGKPLVGPLRGFRSIKYSRYRAIFRAEEKKLAGGETIVHVSVQVLLTGTRKERDRNDVYEVAKKLVDLGVIPVDDTTASDHDELM